MKRIHGNQHGLIKHPWVSHSGKPLTPLGKKEDGKGSNIWNREVLADPGKSAGADGMRGWPNVGNAANSKPQPIGRWQGINPLSTLTQPSDLLLVSPAV